MQIPLRLAFLFFLCFEICHSTESSDSIKFELHGSGWYQFGRIMHSSDTVDHSHNYNKNWIQSPGSQFTIKALISDQLEAAIGLGGYQIQTAQGSGNAIIATKVQFFPYLTESRFTYFPISQSEPKWIINLGLFPYQYNQDTRNLGSYLFRGPVYPGLLFSEFQSKTLDTTVGNVLGLNIHNQYAFGFSHDLIFKSETDLPPIFDISVAYLAKYKIGGFEFGTGINLYRILPANKKVTQLTDKAFPVESGSHPYDGRYGYQQIDSSVISGKTVYDTTNITISHQGIKLMGQISLDFNTWAKLDGFGKFKLFSEFAVLGTKSYKGVYPKITERIPIMVGLYLPVPYLSEFLIEAEYYGARYKNDYLKLWRDGATVPVSNQDYSREQDTSGHLKGRPTVIFTDPVDINNMVKDNIKWSVYMSKSYYKNTKVSLQIANDHFRPYNQYIAPAEGDVSRYATAFSTLKDWYAMFKIGFNF